MNAIPPNLALLAWQETHPERLHVEGNVARHFRGQRFPFGDGRAAKARVNAVVVATDFQNEPAVKLARTHRGLGFGIIAALGGNGGLGRSRQQVHGPHHRADQPLDVTAEVRARQRPVREIDPPFGTGSMEFRTASMS